MKPRTLGEVAFGRLEFPKFSADESARAGPAIAGVRPKQIRLTD